MELLIRVGYDSIGLDVRHGDESAGRSTAKMILGKRARFAGFSAGPAIFRSGKRQAQ